MSKKYVSLSKLSTFLDNLKNTFATLSHKHTLSDISDYTVDSQLSKDSTNPVQNKVLDAEFEAVSEAMNALESAIDDKLDSTTASSTYETTEDAQLKLDEAKSYTDSVASTKADATHNHDDIYYTEAEIDEALAGKADKDHAHDLSAYETTTNATAKLAEAKSYSDTNLATAKSYTDTKTADLASTTVVDNKITEHNTSTTAHNDIRVLISDLTTKLNNFLDVDDTTSDQLSEVLTLIENNKGTLESLTTSKVNVSDIINNLTTNSTDKVLSASQGVAIKALIDALQEEVDALQTEVDGKADASHTHDDRYYTETEVDTAIANSKNTWYGTCPTAANTAAKVVTTNTGNFSLTTGNIVYVLFTYAAYSNSTLNVDGTGAIAIKTAGTTGVTTYQWAANEAIGFVYDGTYFRMLDGMVANTTYYGMTKLSSSTSSTSTTMAATPSAVKSAYDLANGKVSKSGDTMTGALILKPASGEGGQIQLEASTADEVNNGICIDTANGDFRIFGLESSDGTSKTGYGTVLNIDPYDAKISGGYTFDGNVLIESKVKLDYDSTNECLNFVFV